MRKFIEHKEHDSIRNNDRLRNNFLNLCRDVLVDEQTTMYWMIRRHLLASTMQCPKCM